MAKGRVAVVGAGLSGISCAKVLHERGVSVHVYERAPKVGGRCASRLWQGHLVDYGVQYFHCQAADFKRELVLRLRQFRALTAEVSNAEDEPIANPRGPRFYVLPGNNYLPHVLAQGLDVRLLSFVEEVTFQPGGIVCQGETYDAVVSSLPGPQTARLLGLPVAPAYEACLTALVEYEGDPVGTSSQWYGRLAPENFSALASSYNENHKVGRIVGAKTVFVLQATPEFSRVNAERLPEDYLPQLLRENEELWQVPKATARASSGHRWRLARPAPGGLFTADLPTGAFACGDAWAGSSVEQVWLNGRRVADEVQIYLSQVARG